MKGTILDYSVENNLGYITSDDGKGYHFSSEDWKDSKILPKKNLLVDFEIEGNKAINILTISTEAKDKKDLFNNQIPLSWFDFLVKISTIMNTVLLFILLIVITQTAREIKSFTEKTNLSLQVFEQKTIPFFETFNFGKKILIYFLGEQMDIPITVTEEEIEKELLKFLEISEQEIKEKQKEMNYQARQIDGKNAVFGLNRSQQAYHFEKGEFTDHIDNLGVIISTDYYNIQILKDGEDKVISTAIPIENDLKAYVGIIEFDKDNSTYNQLLCQTNSPSQSIEIPVNTNQCGNDSSEIK